MGRMKMRQGVMIDTGLKKNRPNRVFIKKVKGARPETMTDKRGWFFGTVINALKKFAGYGRKV